MRDILSVPLSPLPSPEHTAHPTSLPTSAHTHTHTSHLTHSLTHVLVHSPAHPHIPPHRFIDHGRYEDQIAEAGLSASHIASTALSVLGKPKDAQLTLSGISA